MSKSVKIVLAQQNFIVGNFSHNLKIMSRAIEKANQEMLADLIIFPELALCGYPPEDLLLRKGFLEQSQDVLEKLAGMAKGIDIIVGHPLVVQATEQPGNRQTIYNAATLLRNGKPAATYLKHSLPNYSVFDEKRYFIPGKDACVFDIKNIRCGLTICEDIWEPEPAEQAKQAGAEVIININASPFHINKQQEREEEVKKRVEETGLPVIYVNNTGGQDELVFDGGSFAIDSSGVVQARAPQCSEQLLPVSLVSDKDNKLQISSTSITPIPGIEQSIYQVLVLGVRDYVEKNGFSGVVIGLSGGIDSALTLAIAVDALGPEKVEGVMMPSRFTSSMSIEDAATQARILGVNLREISIEPMFKSFIDALSDEFSGTGNDSTEENIQARIRGILLMAISNKFGKMVLTTGNKSEMAVGYATLYGDMAGGYAAIKDVPKTMVYRLANYLNQKSEIIPKRVIERPPSAELAPDQKDIDSLPEYDVLDKILEQYIELDKCSVDIVEQGFDAGIVDKVIKMVDKNEYKRRQAAPGVRITRRAFGRDRRYPITSGYGKS